MKPFPHATLPNGLFHVQTPQQPRAKEDCEFYHSMTFPDGESVTGVWDIRGQFEQYISNVPLKGKTVLDVGTATGFCAFSAEQAGAKVTAIDIPNMANINLIPFKENPYYSGNRDAWLAEAGASLDRLKSGFWYSWHKFNSNINVIYEPLEHYYMWTETFDVVMASALLEHISDPVQAIGAFSRLAKETVIIGFTPVLDTDELIIRPITNFDDYRNSFTWWQLSRGLYRQIFENIGFSIDIRKSIAIHEPSKRRIPRYTIVATRKK